MKQLYDNALNNLFGGSSGLRSVAPITAAGQRWIYTKLSPFLLAGAARTDRLFEQYHLLVLE
jgi:hypothetical protein